MMPSVRFGFGVRPAALIGERYQQEARQSTLRGKITIRLRPSSGSDCSNARARMIARRLKLMPVVYAQAQRKGRDPRRSTQPLRFRTASVNQPIYLTQYGLMAERHWREFRPKMVRELEAKGTLMEALFEAQETTHRRNGSSHPAARNGAEADSAAGARSGVGDDPGEIHSSPAGRRRELNARNYRIRAEDRLGDGSLKQKFRDNVAAIHVVRQLQLEERSATDDEKRLLVKYVGWGGIPQVFASPPPAEWRDESEELKALLTPDEFDAARASTLNAHYTSATVISAIYDAVDRMGFDGGRVLEPALGVGHFFGLMPEEISARSLLTGVEIDPLTAAIAQQLYPGADIRAQGYETAALPNESFDLAISNVPFGDYKLHDPQFNDRNFLVHDYFFAKTVEHVRAGGLIAFITSKGTLDKVNSSLREYLAEKVDFVGAIRLPNTAFKKNANTEVTTDIVFLRKLQNGETAERSCVVEPR